MYQRLFILVVIAAAVGLISGFVHAVTCEECQQMDQEKRALLEELEEKRAELNAAFKQRQYQDVKAAKDRINEIRRKLIDIRKMDSVCREACRPDVAKRQECTSIKREIVSLEGTGAVSEEQMRKVDALYLKLRECNRELEALLEHRQY